jgi:hypothetical protein
MSEIKVVPCPWHETGFTLRRDNAIIWPDGYHQCCGTEAEALEKAAELSNQEASDFSRSLLETNIAPTRTPEIRRLVETRPPAPTETCGLPKGHHVGSVTVREVQQLDFDDDSANPEPIEQAAAPPRPPECAFKECYGRVNKAGEYCGGHAHMQFATAAEPALERTPRCTSCYAPDCHCSCATCQQKLKPSFNSEPYPDSDDDFEGCNERPARAVAVPEPAAQQESMFSVKQFKPDVDVWVVWLLNDFQLGRYATKEEAQRVCDTLTYRARQTKPAERQVSQEVIEHLKLDTDNPIHAAPCMYYKRGKCDCPVGYYRRQAEPAPTPSRDTESKLQDCAMLLRRIACQQEDLNPEMTVLSSGLLDSLGLSGSILRAEASALGTKEE